MSIIDILRGYRCDSCGRRSDTVGHRAALDMTLCSPCVKAVQLAGARKRRRINTPGRR